MGNNGFSFNFISLLFLLEQTCKVLVFLLFRHVEAREISIQWSINWITRRPCDISFHKANLVSQQADEEKIIESQ